MTSNSRADLSGRICLVTGASIGIGGATALQLAGLTNILFTRELSRRLAGTRVSANCVPPGGVKTGGFRENRGIVRPIVHATGPDAHAGAEG